MPQHRGRKILGGGLCIATAAWSTCFVTTPSLGKVTLQQRPAHGMHSPSASNGGLGCSLLPVGLGLASIVGGLLHRASVRRRAIPGEKAQDFNLPDENGRMLSLESFPGKNLLIWWYPEANTHA